LLEEEPPLPIVALTRPILIDTNSTTLLLLNFDLEFNHKDYGGIIKMVLLT
jgi:hypothetical protein